MAIVPGYSCWEGGGVYNDESTRTRERGEGEGGEVQVALALLPYRMDRARGTRGRVLRGGEYPQPEKEHYKCRVGHR